MLGINEIIKAIFTAVFTGMGVLSPHFGRRGVIIMKMVVSCRVRIIIVTVLLLGVAPRIVASKAAGLLVSFKSDRSEKLSPVCRVSSSARARRPGRGTNLYL